MPRKRKPTQLKVLDGSAAKNPQLINKREPKAPSGMPPCPSHLDAVGKKAFAQMAGWCKEMHMLSPVYGPILELYAETYSAYRKALANVKKHGAVKNDRQSGWHIVMVKNRDMCFKLLGDLGFTPAAKSKVITEDTDKDDLRRFFG